MRIPVYRSVLLLWLLLWLSCATAGESKDPTAWTPPTEPPALRELLKDAAYQKALQDALRKFDPQLLEKSQDPTDALIVTRVRKGQPAEQLGLVRGDLIFSVDGTAATTPDQFNALRKEQQQQLVWQDQQGVRHTSPIEPGKIGVDMDPFWRPELSYIRGKERNAAYDKEVAVACGMRVEDPALAETCLRQAIAQGCKGAFCDRMAMEICERAGRLPEAMAFAWLVMQTQPDWPRARWTFFRCALSTYKLDAALQTLYKYPELDGGQYTEELRRLIGEHGELPVAEHEAPAPSEAAPARFYDDVAFRAKGLSRVNSDFALNQLATADYMWFRVPSGHYRPIVLGPVGRDMEISCRVLVERNDADDTGFSNIAAVGFMDQDDQGFNGNANNGMAYGVLGLRMDDPAQIEIVHKSEMLQLRWAPPIAGFKLKRENTLRMIVHHDRGEIFLNGQRIFYGPLGCQPKRLAPYIKSVGMMVKLMDLHVSELVDLDDPQTEARRELNTVYKGGQSRLHRAAHFGRTEDVRRLLAAGADFNLKDSDGATAMHIAAWINGGEIVDLLAAKGAVRDMFVLAAVGKPEEVEQALQADATAAQKVFAGGRTALHVAARLGRTEIMQKLLAAKANINAREKDQRTPLMEAAAAGQKAAVELLLASGANLNLGDKQGQTALTYAENFQRAEVIDLLRTKGGLQKAPRDDNPEQDF